MSEIKLLPCPFCGGEGKLKVKWRRNGECITKIECFCGACIENIGPIPYKEKIVKQWNTRKAMQSRL